jgi:TIR domain
VFDACTANYTDSVASRFLREDLPSQLFAPGYSGDIVENYTMLIELLKRGIQPISRVVPEVLRLQRVRPKSLVDAMLNDVKSYDVFISHMSSDKPFARGLGKALQARGHTVWLDEWVMRPGDVLSRQIAEGIESSKHFVILLSKTALERDWVIYELDLALVRQVETRGATRFVIPVLLDDVDPPSTLRHLLYRRATTADDPSTLAEALFPS